MKGQWIGTYTGSNDGQIIANIDEDSSFFKGVAYLNDSNNKLPSVAASFQTLNKDKLFNFKALLSPINPNNGTPAFWKDIAENYDPTVVIPSKADVTGSFNDETLNLSWVTDIGTQGSCSLPKSKAGTPPELPLQSLDWKDYKKYISEFEGRRLLFRGQNEPQRLRTSFHRTGRADLNRFIFEDTPMLHRHLSARTRHFFNLSIGEQNGAFWNLVQHHGYPTPLLDWSYSPYVAAFFAYRGISTKTDSMARADEKVRVLMFDHAQWKLDFNQLAFLAHARPHLSVWEFIAIENERMIPQQSVSTVTNIDDIESYIKYMESNGKKYLWAIDLPVSERKLVIQELSYMGITAGSLFPGLDGACEELRERNFEI